MLSKIFFKLLTFVWICIGSYVSLSADVIRLLFKFSAGTCFTHNHFLLDLHSHLKQPIVRLELISSFHRFVVFTASTVSFHPKINLIN